MASCDTTSTCSHARHSHRLRPGYWSARTCPATQLPECSSHAKQNTRRQADGGRAEAGCGSESGVGGAGKCGYHMVPLQDILAAGRLKFLDLLGTKLSAAVAEAISRDKQAGCCLSRSFRSTGNGL